MAKRRQVRPGVITRDEWLEALGTVAEPVDPDALTVLELAQKYRMGRHATYRRCVDLVARGKAIQVWKHIMTTQGYQKRVPAYKLVK